MRVLLSTPPGKTTELWPPLGLLYTASSTMRVRDDDLRIVDAFCENLSAEQLIERVRKDEPDVFGLNCCTHTFLVAVDVLRQVKQIFPDTKTVMGGFHVTFAAEQILRKYRFVDFILKGEAEHSFPRLLHHIENESSPSDVEGISYVNGGQYVSQPSALIKDLDSLPIPARELLSDIEYGYSHQGIPLTYGKFTTICTSRGCPFNCRFCSCAAFSQNRCRTRTAENVVAELEKLYDDGYECCVVIDDNFTHNRRRVERICELIKARGIRLQLYCEGRADNASYEMFKKMKGAGFNVMYFGVESGSPKVLEYYNKTVRPDLARKAVITAKRAGMIVVCSFIFGAPVETKEDIEDTLNFIKCARPHAIQINALDCLIGTPLWDDLMTQGVIGEDDWEKNHRIWDYDEGVTKEGLEAVVNKGYATYVNAWKDLSLLPTIVSLLMRNKTARQVIVHNVLNPALGRRLGEDMRRAKELPW